MLSEKSETKKHVMTQAEAEAKLDKLTITAPLYPSKEKRYDPFEEDSQ